MNNNSPNERIELTVFPREAIDSLIQRIEEISDRIESLKKPQHSREYITAAEFMQQTQISRSMFDYLRQRNEIKVIKRGRKLYLPAGEVKKYIEGK